MALDQLIFDEVIVEAEERHRAAQDELRSDVQQWFDRLTGKDVYCCDDPSVQLIGLPDAKGVSPRKLLVETTGDVMKLASGKRSKVFGVAMAQEVLWTPGVLEIIRHDGSPAPVRDEELDAIRILVAGVNAGGSPPEPVEFLYEGQEVIVTEGPFGGIRGMLVEDRSRTRVVIRLSALRRALSVELPREMLRAAAE